MGKFGVYIKRIEVGIYSSRSLLCRGDFVNGRLLLSQLKLKMLIFFHNLELTIPRTEPFCRIPMNYLILNLAVADIMVALFIVPRFIFVHIFNHPDGMMGTVLCKLLTGGNLIWIGSVATAFTLVVVAIERYNAVINSHSNQGQLTATKVEVSAEVF